MAGPTLSTEGLPFLVSLRIRAILFVPRLQSTVSPGGDQKLEKGVSQSRTPTVTQVGD